MKTITLELDEQIYPQVVSLLRLLPEDLCCVMEDNEGVLNRKECSSNLENKTLRTYREPPPELADKMRFLCDEQTLIEPIWFEEVAIRAAELDQGLVQRIPADEARALLK